MPSLRRSYASEYCATSCKIGTTDLRLGYLLFESADCFAIIPSGYRRDSRLERTGFLDAPGFHVFEKLRPGFGLLDQIENCLGLGLIDRSSGSVVIIPDDHDIEDVARDVPAEKRIGAPDGLHVRLAARSVERGRHIGIFVMAARQVLQPAADQDAAAPARFVGIGEIHPLFRQQRAQMFVDLLERRVFEGFIRAILWIA